VASNHAEACRGRHAAVLPASFFALSQRRHRGRIRVGGGAVFGAARRHPAVGAGVLCQPGARRSHRRSQGGVSQAGFKTYVCTGSNTSALVSALFTCSNIMINVQNYTDFASASTTSPTLTFNNGNVSNTWSYNTGNPGDIIVVQVMYQWPVVLGPLSMNLSNLSNGNRLLVSTAVFKSEPY
jgi:hypothetical protein